MCAEINKNNQEEDERKAPNSNSLYGGFYRRFNSIFRFEIEYRTIVLSRRIHLIDLGRWSALLRWLIHLRDMFFTHKSLVHRNFCTGLDSLWTQLDDPAPAVCERPTLWTWPYDPAPTVCEHPNLSVQVQKIWPYPEWSKPGTFWAPDSLWVTLDDPDLYRMIRT